jgi:hypothetical protein
VSDELDESAEAADIQADTGDDAADSGDETGPDASDGIGPDAADGTGPEAADGTGAADVIRPEPTGVPTVDAAVERLAELDDLPTGEHVAIYDAAHRQLQDALADLDGA